MTDEDFMYRMRLSSLIGSISALIAGLAIGVFLGYQIAKWDFDYQLKTKFRQQTENL